MITRDMEIRRIWFDGNFLYGEDSAGDIHKQSLLWYPKLAKASENQRNDFRFGFEGIHWESLGEDVSFESFVYPDAIPSPLQEFFLTHDEINVSGFGKFAGINPTLLRDYINGFKKPSPKRVLEIQKAINYLGEIYSKATIISQREQSKPKR